MSTVTVDVTALQRRTVARLVVVQAVGALGITIGIATSSLLARDLSGSETMAGLAQTAQVLGTAFAAWLLGRLMTLRGRRFGLVIGYFIAASGALSAVLAGVIGSMTMLLVAMVMLGSASATNNAARYAATDLADDSNRGRSLSVVVWATTIGAVLGPNLSGPSSGVARLIDVPVLAGPFFVAGIGLVLAAGLTFWLLRPDPLLTARAIAHTETGVPPRAPSWRNVRDAVRERPVLAAAAGGMAAAHATMIAVMVMTPLHMEHGGAELDVIGFVISVHVLGMFAFAPLVGWAADRYGRSVVMVGGGMVLLLSLLFAGLAPAGSSWQIFGGLFLLGLGWSLATISASTLIAEHSPLSVRADVQGSADMVMSLAAAAASAAAGVIVGSYGFPALAAYAALLAAGVVVAGIFVARHAHDITV